MSLARNDLSDYGEAGYVLAKLLDAAEVDHVLAEADRLQRMAAELDHSDGDFNLEAPDGGYVGQNGTSTGYKGLLRKVSNTVRHSAVVRDLSKQASITGLASRLLGGAPCELAHSVLWFKPPQVGSPKPPHQDAPYLAGDATRYVTIWIALDDCTPENGCLAVVAGSHRHGSVPHEGTEARVPDAQWEGARHTPVPLSPGEAIAFHPYLLHASGPNRSSRPRRALTLRYLAAR
jgi:hypothetical protein